MFLTPVCIAAFEGVAYTATNALAKSGIFTFPDHSVSSSKESTGLSNGRSMALGTKLEIRPAPMYEPIIDQFQITCSESEQEFLSTKNLVQGSVLSKPRQKA